MNKVLHLIFPLVFCFVATQTVTGCAADSASDETYAPGVATAAITGSDVVQRASEWTDVMPYCGAPNGRADPTCGGTCRRTGAAKDPTWDAYRSDCSGLVSWAWGLAAPGLTTTELATHSDPIPWDELAPGDILLTTGHVVLFVSWTDKAAGKATIIHEGRCGEMAKELSVQLSQRDGSSVVLWGQHYVARRGHNVDNSGW